MTKEQAIETINKYKHFIDKSFIQKGTTLKYTLLRIELLGPDNKIICELNPLFEFLPSVNRLEKLEDFLLLFEKI